MAPLSVTADIVSVHWAGLFAGTGQLGRDEYLRALNSSIFWSPADTAPERSFDTAELCSVMSCNLPSANRPTDRMSNATSISTKLNPRLGDKALVEDWTESTRGSSHVPCPASSSWPLKTKLALAGLLADAGSYLSALRPGAKKVTCSELCSAKKITPQGSSLVLSDLQGLSRAFPFTLTVQVLRGNSFRRRCRAFSAVALSPIWCANRKTSLRLSATQWP